MLIEKLEIKNYKSIGDITIDKPSPFTVFVGANASGKSNIFEAIEFLNFSLKYNPKERVRLYGGNHSIINLLSSNYPLGDMEIKFTYKDIENSHIPIIIKTSINKNNQEDEIPNTETINLSKELLTKFMLGHSRIFINTNNEKIPYNDNEKLSTSCRNLEKVLSRILNSKEKRQEIVEWLELLIPGFVNIEINTDFLSDFKELLIYEKKHSKPFTRNFISDGTFNIIALLTAVYQSDEPQFLCIEEPENGLNPKVIKKLVSFFRQQCEEKGHYIWLNTHSQTLVRELTNQEVILVDKIDGQTQVKQIKDKNLYGMPMDEALMTNTLGGGIPW
jgi:predicted ATPase